MKQLIVFAIAYPLLIAMAALLARFIGKISGKEKANVPDENQSRHHTQE